jgi:hypothetical protein
MVSLGGAAFAAEETAVLAAVTAANRRRIPGPGSQLGTWLHNGVAVEYRAFVPSGLLDTLTHPERPALIGNLIDEAVAQQAGPDAAGNPPEPLCTRWPGDDQAAVLARRDPPNDGLDNVSPDRSIFLDRFGHGCALTDKSFRGWRRTLTDDDIATSGVAAFSRFVESCIADRAARRSTSSRAGDPPPTSVGDRPKMDGS